MANVWQCDICKRIFTKDDAGFLNKHNVYIAINMGIFDGLRTFVYDDVCNICREEISEAISSTIHRIKGC